LLSSPNNISKSGGHLTENLYKYRFFISEEIFEKLHRFKQISQDAIILRDTFTRDEKLFETEEYQRELESKNPQSSRLG